MYVNGIYYFSMNNFFMNIKFLFFQHAETEFTIFWNGTDFFFLFEIEKSLSLPKKMNINKINVDLL